MQRNNFKEVVGDDGKSYEVDYNHRKRTFNTNYADIFPFTKVCGDMCEVYTHPVLFYCNTVVALIVLMLLLVHVSDKRVIGLVFVLYVASRVYYINRRFSAPVPLRP